MRVLAVDDQVLLLLDLMDQLNLNGIDTVPAANAAEALDRLDGRIDAVVTDIEMPGSMSGIDLAWQIHRSNPNLPIVVSSGRVRPARGELPPQAVFLPKPLHMSDLLRVLCRPAPARHAA